MIWNLNTNSNFIFEEKAYGNVVCRLSLYRYFYLIKLIEIRLTIHHPLVMRVYVLSEW